MCNPITFSTTENPSLVCMVCVCVTMTGMSLKIQRRGTIVPTSAQLFDTQTITSIKEAYLQDCSNGTVASELSAFKLSSHAFSLCC